MCACSSPQRKATKIVSPAVKSVQKAEALVARQSESIGRIRGGLEQSSAIADQLDALYRTEDTGRLKLTLRTGVAETIKLETTTEDLRLVLSNTQIQLGDAKTQIANETANANSWRKWAWRWFSAFAGLIGLVGLFVAFRGYLKTAPIIGRFL